MNDLLGYVIESFLDSRQAQLNMLSTPEVLKSKDVVGYIHSNMKGSKAKPGAFLREGALYFLSAMVKEGGALERGKPGTAAPGYAYEGGKKEYGKVRGDSPLRKVQRPLIVPKIDYPSVPKEKIVDIVTHEALAIFRRWSNRNKPRFFAYKSTKPITDSELEDNTTELMEIYGNHTERFERLHNLVIEHSNASEINFSPKKGKLPIGVKGVRTGITITRPPQAQWLCLKLRMKEGATWSMYSSSVGKLGVILGRSGMQPMVSTYGNLWDIWLLLPDKMSMPDAYDIIGRLEGIERVGRGAKGVSYRPFLLDSIIISDSTFTDPTAIFPLSLHIHHGKEKTSTLKAGEGNQDFSIDTGLSMIPSSGMLTVFDSGIENHPLQAMFNAPDLLARVYRFARAAEIIPQLPSELPLLEIDSELSNLGREAWMNLKEIKSDEETEPELKVIPKGRDITLVYDGKKAYLTGLPDDRKLTNIPQTDEFAQLCTAPTTAYGKIQGGDADSLVALLTMLDVNDYDENKILQAFSNRTILIWRSPDLNSVSGRFIRSIKRAEPDDLHEMWKVAPFGLLGIVGGTEKIMPLSESTPVIVLGYEKSSVQNNEARVLIVGKIIKSKVDVLVRGITKPTKKAGEQKRDEYQEVARIGTYSGFTYEDRKDMYEYMQSLEYHGEHEGDILLDPLEANLILEMEYKGLLADKPMWRYNRKGHHRDWEDKQKLPGGGERIAKGHVSKYSMEPLSKESMPQYNNPKIVGYRVDMGRDEQRIRPYLIASSDVAYGVGMKKNPPLTLSRYTNYLEKENSPFYAVLGFTGENYAKEDKDEFTIKMKKKFGATTQVKQSERTLTAMKKGTKLGELCENCGGPKTFSPPGFTKQERAADEGPSVYFSCKICGRQTRQRDRRNPPQYGWNTIMDWTNDGTWADEFLQIKSATKQMMEWFPDNNFSIRTRNERINYEGDINDNGVKFNDAMTNAVWDADFPQPSNVLIITDKKYKGNYFGYTSGWYDGEVRSQSRNDNPWHLVLFSLPHLRNHDEETNFMTICHEWGHHMIRKGIESEGRGRLDDSYHCKDKSCVMSLESYKMAHFKNKLKAEGRFNKSMFCDLCEAEIGLKASPFLKDNPLVAVSEYKEQLKTAQTIIDTVRDHEYNHTLTEESAPYLHTSWPAWFRRSERDLVVRGLERQDYLGVIKGIANKTGAPYYGSLLSVAKRNSGKSLIKNRTQHQELAMLYTLCHNDVDFILAWPNATSSSNIEAFEAELEKSTTLIYQKEVTMTKKAAAVLCMQMYAGEKFVSKKQCIRKTLASGWTQDDADKKERKLRIYILHNNTEKSLRGKGAQRKEELRSIFKTSKDDKKSYIHTADDPVQVSEYAQVLLNQNSLNLLQNNDINMLLPQKSNKEWLMVNSTKKFMQQEFGSLFFMCSSLKSGSGAYLHGIRKTNDIDIMIDDRRLGPDTKKKAERMKELLPWTDYSLAYSDRGNPKFWKFETFIPGSTFYDKRCEMTHNPKYHAYFLGMKVETPEAFLYSRMRRVSNDSRPRPTGDILMLIRMVEEGRFVDLDKKIILPWSRGKVLSLFSTLGDYYHIVRFWLRERYGVKMEKKEIHEAIESALKRGSIKRNGMDIDATEERLLSSIDGRYNDFSETRNNPPEHRIIMTVPHALPAGDDVEDHWCDWSAASAATQLFEILKEKHDPHLQMADKARTEIDYNRVISAETRWQLNLDGLLEDADMLVDVHSFPVDDPMWAGYDFVLFSCDRWPMKAQNDQAQLMEHLRKNGYKVMMDIADHRNYIQEKGVELGIPSFLIEFGEHLKLKKPCETLAEGLEKFLVKTNPVLPLKRHGWFEEPAYQTYDENEEINHKETKKLGKKHDKYVKELMRKKYPKWNWTQPPLEGKEGERESKLLEKAREKADKELHQKLCKKDNGKPCKDWYGDVKNDEGPHCYIGKFKLCLASCKFCWLEQVKQNPITPETPHGGSIMPTQHYVPADPSTGRKYHIKFEYRGAWEDRTDAGFTGMPCDMDACNDETRGNPPNTHVVISRSDKADKKLKAVFHKPNGRTTTTHFGGKHYSDYTIHKDRKRMERYNNRHRTNENWNKFMSAGALSKWLLWNKPSLKGSFDDYLDMFGITGELKVKTSQAGEIKHGKKNPPVEGITWETRENPIGLGVPLLFSRFIKGMTSAENSFGEFPIVNPPQGYYHVTQTLDKIKENPTPHFFPGEAVKKFPWLKHSNLISTLKNNPKAPGYNSYAWTTQDWRSIKVNNKGEVDYSEKCGAEDTQVADGTPRLCLPAEVVRALLKSKDGKEILLTQARKKARAAKGQRIPWHPRIKKLWKRVEEKTVKDRPNPPVFPQPQRVTGKKGGKYTTDKGVDVTGRHFKLAKISGKDKTIHIEWENETDKPAPRPAPRTGMRRTRFNMLRPSKFEVVDTHRKGFSGQQWIIATETSQGHTYSLHAVVEPPLTLQTFPNKKSEPRLRPETYGAITPTGPIAFIRIKSSGKKHPLYQTVTVQQTTKEVKRREGIQPIQS